MADDIVKKACYSAIALLHTAVLFAKLLRNPAAGRIGLTRTCCGQRSRNMGCRRHRSKKIKDRKQHMLAQRLDDIRVQSFSEFIQAYMQLNGYVAMMFGLRLIAGLPLIGSGPEAAIVASSYMISFVFFLCPALMNARTLWLVYCVFEAPAITIGIYYALADPNLFANYYTLILLYRFTVSIAYPVASFYMPANVLWGVLSSFALLRAEARAGQPISNLVGNEVIIVCFMSHLAWKFGALQTSYVRSDLEAARYLKSKKTMERLLANMCDAVVELDPNLEVKEACPKLANLLLRHDTANALEGERFANLMFKEADREQFDHFVARRTIPIEDDENLSDSDQASMFLNLRDAYGTPVSVQLFHSCHHSPPDEVCHIVGVHEVERDTGADVVPDTFGAPEIHAAPNDGTESVASAISSGSGFATCDTSIVLAPSIPEQAMLAAVSLLFNPITMEIIACTMGLKSLTGPLVYKGSLRDCIVNYGQFCEWMTFEVNTFLDELFTGEHSELQLKVSSPTYRKHANLQYIVGAHILQVLEDAKASEMGVDLPQDCDDECHQLLCVLEFRNAQPRWRYAKRKPSLPNRRMETHSGQGELLMAL